MSGEMNRGIKTDMLGYLQENEKRLSMEERRPRVDKASDLLGPLAGPGAYTLNDSLDSNLLVFSGNLVVPIGTPESPDPTVPWIGQSIAQDGTGGVQVLYTYRVADAKRAVTRSWEVVAGTGGLRAYGPWRSVGPQSYEAVTLGFVSPFTSGSVVLNRVGDVVYASGGVVRNATPADQNFYPATANIPLGMRPVANITEPAFPIFSSTTNQWQAQILTSGVIQIRMIAAATNTLGFGTFSWFTADDPSGLTPV